MKLLDIIDGSDDERLLGNKSQAIWEGLRVELAHRSNLFQVHVGK
jgi:hypothetical protein